MARPQLNYNYDLCSTERRKWKWAVFRCRRCCQHCATLPNSGAAVTSGKFTANLLQMLILLFNPYYFISGRHPFVRAHCTLCTLNSIKWQFSCWTAWAQVLYWLLINFESAAPDCLFAMFGPTVLWPLPWMSVQMNCVIWFISDNCVWYRRSSTRYWLPKQSKKSNPHVTINIPYFNRLAGATFQQDKHKLWQQYVMFIAHKLQIITLVSLYFRLVLWNMLFAEWS